MVRTQAKTCQHAGDLSKGEMHTGLQAARRRHEEVGASRAAPHVEATGWVRALGRSKTRMPPTLCQDLLEQAWLICRRPIEGELHTGLQAAHRRREEEGTCRAASHMEATGWLGATGQVSLGPLPASMNIWLRVCSNPLERVSCKQQQESLSIDLSAFSEGQPSSPSLCKWTAPWSLAEA